MPRDGGVYLRGHLALAGTKGGIRKGQPRDGGVALGEIIILQGAETCIGQHNRLKLRRSLLTGECFVKGRAYIPLLGDIADAQSDLRKPQFLPQHKGVAQCLRPVGGQGSGGRLRGAEL